MNGRDYRKIAGLTAIVGIVSFVFLSAAQAQQAPDARRPPPNPEPPPTSAAAGGAAGATAVEPGYLGIVADDRQEKGAGVRVVELAAGSPAEQAGLKADDLITKINGSSVHNQSDMTPVLQRLSPGSKVTFTVDRAGQSQSIEVTLGTRPPAGQRRFEKFGTIPETLPGPNSGGGIGPDSPSPEPGRIPADAAPNGAPSAGPSPGSSNPPGAPNQPLTTEPFRLGAGNFVSRRPLLGVRTRPLTEETRQRLHLASANGALVVSRTLGSPAATAGIPLDAVITAVDGKPIASPLDLTQLVTQAGPGREIEITYFHGGAEKQVKVKLAEFAGEPGGLLGGGGGSPGAIPAPPAPQGSGFQPPADRVRIESLERRVQQLEHRVDDLEQALNKSK